MLNRREWLGTTGAMTLSAWTGVSNAEESEVNINDTLEQIACVLSASNHIDNVEMHLVDKPTIGLTQWRWLHFNDWLTSAELNKVETVNGQLLDVMKDIFDQGDMGLDHLMLEGLVEGNMHNQISSMRDTQYQMVAKLMQRANPFSMSMLNPRHDLVLQCIDNEKYIYRRLFYRVDRKRHEFISPLTRLGAGYILATQRKILFDAAEDPEIDREAEKAQRGNSEELFDEWVIQKRNAHFVKLIRKNRRQLTHLLVGALHNLRDDITLSNEVNPEKISHLVVSVKGLRPVS